MKSNKQTYVGVFSGLLVVAIFFLFLGFGPQRQGTSQNISTTAPTSNLANVATSIDTAKVNNKTGVITEDLVVGTGAEAKNGDKIVVDYVGKFEDGKIFDSSKGRGPFTFTLGAGQVIQGWEQGILGMKEGGKRILVIPPALGYGASDVGPIPANSTLIFEVDLISVGK